MAHQVDERLRAIIDSLKGLCDNDLSHVFHKLVQERRVPPEVYYHLTKVGQELIRQSDPQLTSSEVIGRERQMLG